jgi:ABC-type phosphate/phosphonate transport system substrate-binding protein
VLTFAIGTFARIALPAILLDANEVMRHQLEVDGLRRVAFPARRTAALESGVRLRRAARLEGRPRARRDAVYAAEGCEGPRYRSFVLVRGDRPFRRLGDLLGWRAAVNEATSHSGSNAWRPLAAALAERGQFFGDVIVTGSHTDSLLALHVGEADVACVDAVVGALLLRQRPSALRGLRPIGCTATAMAPPYVTSAATPGPVRRALRAALTAAAVDPTLAHAREALLLRHFVVSPPSAYSELEAFEQPALAAGYPNCPRRGDRRSRAPDAPVRRRARLRPVTVSSRC